MSEDIATSGPRRKVVVLAAIGLVVGILLGTGIVIGIVRAQGHTIQGNLSLYEGSVGQSIGQICTGTGGYDDIRQGAGVVIRDEANKVLATGSLGAGASLPQIGACLFKFTIGGVGDAAFYQVEVSHRGNVTFSKADMEKDHWTVALEIGQPG